MNTEQNEIRNEDTGATLRNTATSFAFMLKKYLNNDLLLGYPAGNECHQGGQTAGHFQVVYERHFDMFRIPTDQQVHDS